VENSSPRVRQIFFHPRRGGLTQNLGSLRVLEFLCQLQSDSLKSSILLIEEIPTKWDVNGKNMQIVDNNSGITSQMVADFVHQWYQTVLLP